MRMPHQPTATLSPSLVHPHRRRVALFLFATFLPSRPFAASPSFLALLSLTCPSFFSLRNPSLRSLFCLLSLSLFVVPFFPQNIIYLLFVSSYFHSRFRLLYLLLSKIFSPDFLSLVFSARTSIIFIDIYDDDSNYPILAAVAHLVRTKKSFDPIRLFISALFLAAPRPFSSFLDYCSLFSDLASSYFLGFPHAMLHCAFSCSPSLRNLNSVMFHRVRIKCHT